MCAGVDRQRQAACRRPRHRPRVCGGGPLADLSGMPSGKSSPCVRGWTVVQVLQRDPLVNRPRVCGGGPQGRMNTYCRSVIVPVCAGVDRSRISPSPQPSNRPRVCGGGPAKYAVIPPGQKSSPCVRGWTGRHLPPHLRAGHRPRVCGGGPEVVEAKAAWRAIVSVCAGVDRTKPERCRLPSLSSPCVRGWTDYGPSIARRHPHRPRVCGGGPTTRDHYLDPKIIVPVCAGVDRCSCR